MMPEQTDIDICYCRSQQLFWICVGPVVCGVGLYALSQMIVDLFNNKAEGMPLLVWIFALLFWIFLVGGAGVLVLQGVARFRDRTAKLALTAEGLRDHRTGMLIRWANFRGVRLHTVLGKWAIVAGATLYIKVSDKGEKEVKVDVRDLERKPDEIARLVLKRGMAALLQQPAHELPGSAETAAAPDGGGTTVLIHSAIRRTVKLSLSAEGLTDARTGMFLRWLDFRGVWLRTVRTTRFVGFVPDAWLYVTVADGEREREEMIDVSGLELEADKIASLVQKWGMAALSGQRKGVESRGVSQG
jgi:hypothetical protein